jgi:hypothetical protein
MIPPGAHTFGTSAPLIGFTRTVKVALEKQLFLDVGGWNVKGNGCAMCYVFSNVRMGGNDA